MKIAFSSIGRWVAGAMALMMAVVGPLSASPAAAAGAMTWQATVGYQTSSMAIQSNFYFPNNLTIDAGDSIAWTLRSAEFHTITFLPEGKTVADYPFVLNGGLNPAALFPTFLPPGSATYNGLSSGFVNSGLMGIPLPPPVNGVISKYTVKFPNAGTYQYNCLVHTTMKGWVKVQPANTPYPHNQAYYNAQATAAESVSLGQGYTLAALGLAKALAAGVGHVTAGIGKLYSAGSVAVVRFLPQVAFIHAGQKVVWNNRDPEFPHTITFNIDFANPILAFGPQGNVTPDPNGSTGEIGSPSDQLNSGVLVPGGPFGTQFTLTFDTAGVYNYDCALHDDLGMKGTVVVLPRS